MWHFICSQPSYYVRCYAHHDHSALRPVESGAAAQRRWWRCNGKRHASFPIHINRTIELIVVGERECIGFCIMSMSSTFYFLVANAKTLSIARAPYGGENGTMARQRWQKSQRLYIFFNTKESPISRHVNRIVFAARTPSPLPRLHSSNGRPFVVCLTCLLCKWLFRVSANNNNSIARRQRKFAVDCIFSQFIIGNVLTGATLHRQHFAMHRDRYGERAQTLNVYTWIGSLMSFCVLYLVLDPVRDADFHNSRRTNEQMTCERFSCCCPFLYCLSISIDLIG